MFSYGERFQRLWSEIPTVTCYREYIGLCNEIDDCRTGYEITETDEKLLLEAVELYVKTRIIQTKEPDFWNR